MSIDFHKIKEVKVAEMNGSTGEMTVKMHMDEHGKIIPCCIHADGLIGLHKHETSDDINYIISGLNKAVCDGKEALLGVETCDICWKGSEHSIVNTVKIWFC